MLVSHQQSGIVNSIVYWTKRQISQGPPALLFCDRALMAAESHINMSVRNPVQSLSKYTRLSE